MSVTLRNVDTGAERIALTDASGRYLAPSISVGNYRISASKEGFSTQAITGIILVVGQSTTVDVVLPLGTVTQEVEVVETPPTVALTTQQTSGLVSERQVKELPLNGRSYDELITLNPGVINYTAQRTGELALRIRLSAICSPSPDTVRRKMCFCSTALNTQALRSSISRRAVRVGSCWAWTEFVSSTLLLIATALNMASVPARKSASSPLRNKSRCMDRSLNSCATAHSMRAIISIRDPFRYFSAINSAGSLGGPLRRNKLFLFGNYEGFRQNLGLSAVTLVPDNASRALAVPSVQPLLALWPVQNGPELGAGIATAYSHPLQRIREDFGTTRADLNLSNSDSLFATYTIDDSDANTPTVNPLSSVIINLREQVFTVQEQHVFSATLLNTARFGFSRAAFFFTGATPVDVDGWVAGAPIGAVVVGGGTALNGASQISLAGTNAGSNLTTARNLFTFDDHAFISRGRHQIEVGGWVQRIQSNDDLAQYQYGQASFSNLASFLAGKVSTFTVVPAPTELGWRSYEFARICTGHDQVETKSGGESRLPL